MPHEHPNVESALIKNLIAPGNAFALAFLFLIFQYSFKLDFQCPCNAFDSKIFCILYAVLPFCGLWIILTLTSKACTITCAQFSTCSLRCSTGCCGRITCSHIVRNAVLSALWIVTVLIDGDAVVCWKLTDGNITHLYDQIPCKKKENLSSDEAQNIRYYQAVSQVIGLIILFVTPLVWVFCSMIYQCFKTPYKSLFEDVYEEEAMRCVEMEMREMIKKEIEVECKDTLNKIKSCNVDWKELSKELIKLVTKENLQNSLQNIPHPNQAFTQANEALHKAKQALLQANQALDEVHQAIDQANQAPPQPEPGSTSSRPDSSSVSFSDKKGSISAQPEFTTAKEGSSSAKQESTSISSVSSS